MWERVEGELRESEGESGRVDHATVAVAVAVMVISGNGETLPGRTTSGSRKAETCLIHEQSRLDGAGRLVFVLGAWSEKNIHEPVVFLGG